MPKISQLPVATAVNTGDLFVIVQGATTKQATDALVNANIAATIVISESQVTNLTTDLASKLAKASNLSDLASIPTARQNLKIGPLNNGQIVIGSTGVDPVINNLSAGPGITIANGPGSITISGSGSGIGWNHVTGTSASMSADSGYVADNAGLVTLTLPVTAAFGTAISVVGNGAGGWVIAQNGGQNIQVGSVSSTVGAGGSVASTNQFDSINLICTVANTTWTTLGGPQGNLTIV